MDHFHAQHIQGNVSGSPSVDFPQSQELFSDQEHTEHDGEDDHITIRHEAGISSQNDHSNLFEDQIVCTPTRTQLPRRCKQLNSTPIQNTDSDESSEYEPPPRKLALKDIFDNHFRKKRKYKKQKKSKKQNRYLCSEKKQPQKKQKKKRKRLYSISASQRKSRLLHNGIRFPFASKKHLPLKLCFAYEQYVLGGFLNYVKNIKCENHLQKSLLDMNVGKDLEEGSLEERKFKYLDDEEPLSPISESGESDECETQYCDAKIVESSSFILDCRIPSKAQWKIRYKNQNR